MLRLWALLATRLASAAAQEAAAELGGQGEVALAAQRQLIAAEEAAPSGDEMQQIQASAAGLTMLEEAGGVPRPISLEDAGDARRPLSDEYVVKTFESQQSESPQITELENQHDNLTYLVRLQAQVVANESNTLANVRVVQSGKRWQVSELAADYEKATSAADLSETAYQTHLAAIAVARQKRDELKSKTDEARKTFEGLAPQYHAAEYQLNVLISQTPYLATRANATSDEETRKAAILKDASDQKKGVSANLSNTNYRLEVAMKRLNQLHADLASVEAKLGEQKSSALRLSPLSTAATLVTIVSAFILSMS